MSKSNQQTLSKSDLEEALAIARKNYRFLNKRDAEGIVRDIIIYMNNGSPYKNAVSTTLNRYFPHDQDYKKAYISLAVVYFGKDGAKKKKSEAKAKVV